MADTFTVYISAVDAFARDIFAMNMCNIHAERDTLLCREHLRNVVRIFDRTRFYRVVIYSVRSKGTAQRHHGKEENTACGKGTHGTNASRDAESAVQEKNKRYIRCRHRKRKNRNRTEKRRI